MEKRKEIIIEDLRVFKKTVSKLLQYHHITLHHTTQLLNMMCITLRCIHKYVLIICCCIIFI